MEKGKIRNLISDRGFGFITKEQGGDLFFHRSELQGVDYSSLRQGQQVEFEIGLGRDNRPQAVKVRVAQPEPTAEVQQPEPAIEASMEGIVQTPEKNPVETNENSPEQGMNGGPESQPDNGGRAGTDSGQAGGTDDGQTGGSYGGPVGLGGQTEDADDRPNLDETEKPQPISEERNGAELPPQSDPPS